MLKKLLPGSLLIITFGCSSLLNAQSKERPPKLPDNLARFNDECPMDLLKNAWVKKRLRVLPGKSFRRFQYRIK